MIQIVKHYQFDFDLSPSFDGARMVVIVPPAGQYPEREVPVDLTTVKWDLYIKPDGTLYAFTNDDPWDPWWLANRDARQIARIYPNGGDPSEDQFIVILGRCYLDLPAKGDDFYLNGTAFIPNPEQIGPSLMPYDRFFFG